MSQNRKAVQAAKVWWFANSNVKTQMLKSLERKRTPLAQACLAAISYLLC